jgi:hypothetical protein
MPSGVLVWTAPAHSVLAVATAAISSCENVGGQRVTASAIVAA